jgi:hypothetical protein
MIVTEHSENLSLIPETKYCKVDGIILESGKEIKFLPNLFAQTAIYFIIKQ